ncbi:MAG TPA: hypothetical protein VJR92_01915 [Gemmatimonadaceae bacterium]|nr:hypothetical protein [Gemmatimonadaceae bacterium]
MSCGPDFTGPNSSRVRFGALAINPTLPRASQVSGGDIVPFTNVRIVLRRSDESIAVDTIVPFPSNADEISLAISVPLSNSATSEGEAFSLTMEYRNAAGNVVFRAGPVVVLIVPFVPGGPPPTPVDVPADYVGPGAQATRVDINPTAITLSANQSTTFTAQAFDANNTLLPGTPVFFTTNDASIVDVTPAGVATAKNVRGTATITANLLTGQTSPALVTVELPPSALALVSGNNQSAGASATLPAPVVVRVTASDGVGVAGVIVSFAAGNGGSVGAPTVATDAQGNAQTTWTLGGAIGAQSLTATVAGLTGSPVTFNATAVAGLATNLAFTTQPLNGTAGANVGGPITVTARDAFGNVATTFNGNITLGLGTAPGGASIAGTPTVVAVAGVATFANVTLPIAGTYTLTAQSAGLTGATSNTFTIAAAAAAQLAFTVQPSATVASAVIAPAIQVTARDQFGNTATSFAANISLGFGQSPIGATLGGTPTVAAVAGVATFANITLAVVGTYSFTAQAIGLAGATSNTFAISPAGATQLEFTTQPANVAAGAFVGTLTVTARDAGGNVATAFNGNVTLGLGQAPGGATLNGATLVTAVNGVATFGSTSLNLVGTYTLTAQASGLTTATSNTFVVSPGIAAALTFIVQPTASNAGSPISPPVQVAARDAFGNIVTSFVAPISLLLGANPTGTTLIGTTTVNAVAGVATFPTVGVLAAGTGYTLVASSPGPTSVFSATFDVTSTAATQLTFSTQPGNSIAGAVLNGPVTVTARDAGGNVATSFNGAIDLGLGQSPGDVALIGTTSVNAVNGVATFTAVSLNLTGLYSLTAQSTGLTSATSNTFTVAPAAAAALAFTVPPSATNAGVPFTPAVQVIVLDAFSNVVTTFNGAVSLGFGANPTGATLIGTTTVNAVAGVASFPTVGVSAIGQDFTLIASSPGLTSAISGSFNVSLSAIIWTNASGGAWETPSNWNLNRVPQAGDSVVITLAGDYTVTLGSGPTVSYVTLGAAPGTQSLSLVDASITIDNAFTINTNGVLELAVSNLFGTGVVANSGLITAHGGVSIENPITTTAGSGIRVEGNSSYGFAQLTHVSSFTNNGTIELTSVTGAFPAILSSTAGTLTNAALILSNSGTGGGRTIGTRVINQSTLTVQQPLTITKSLTNTGTINAFSDLTVDNAGIDVFTQNGAMNIQPSITVAVNNGAFNHNAGSFSGTGTLSLTNVVAAFGVLYSTANANLVLTASTLSGPGQLFNTSGRTMVVNASNIAASISFTNQGTLVAHGGVNFAAGIVTAVGSTIRVEGNNTYGFATLAFGGTFLNNGTIDLTSVTGAFPSSFTMLTGSLINTVNGTIVASVGTGGGRQFNGRFDNSGTITVNQTLGLNAGNLDYDNNGLIDIVGGDVSVTQITGAVVNAGTLSIGAGRTLTVNNGELLQNAGAITGAGTLSLVGVVSTFSTDFSNAVTGLALTGTILSGDVTLTNAAGRTLVLDASTIGSDVTLVNEGTLVVHGSTGVQGALTTTAGSIIRIEGINTYGFALLQTIPFTNNARIELTSATGAFPATLSVLTGQFTNGIGATIESMAGTGGGRVIDAQVLNEALITVNQPLSMTRANVAHNNVGTIDLVGADMSFTIGTGSLTNVGAMLLGAGRTLSITGGTFVQNGSLTGTGTLVLSNLTATLLANFTNATTTLELNSSIVNGPGAITNAAGRTLMLHASTIGASSLLINDGLLLAHGASAVNGGIITSPGSTIRVEGINTFGFSTLTFANGFTNDGAIELTSSTGAFPADLVVLNGTLNNAATRTIASLAGTGGGRTINAQVLNNGTITVNQALSIPKPGAGHNNTGTINLVGADLSFSLAGGSLDNAGTLSIGAGRVLTVANGEFNQNAGAITGTGTLLLSAVAGTFQTDFTNATTTLELNSSVANGPGTITNAAGRTLMLHASTIGAGALLINDGLLLAHGGSAVNSSIVTSPTSTIRVEGINTFGFSTLTVTNGFQNNGLIELTSSSGAFPAQLNVLNGELENESGATIAALPGTGGGRTLDAQLNNDGTLDVAFPLGLTEVNAIHSNNGSFNITGGDLTQNTGVLNNAGTITIGAGFSLIMNNATLNQAGTITGTGTLNLIGANAALGVNFDNVLTNLALTSTTVSGPGTLTNAAGRTLTLNASTVEATAPFVNLGTVVVHGGSSINGAYTASPGSTLRVEANNTFGFATLTVANEFTNGGTIELTSAGGAFPSTLIVSTGLLTNAVGGKIISMPGTGGGRTLNTQLANLGTVNVDAPLALVSAPDVTHANVGTIDVAGGDFVVTQSGIDAAFGNTGTIQIGAGRTFGIIGGSFVQDLGGVNGLGAISLTGVQAIFNTAFTNAATTLIAVNSEIGGLGTITNATGKTLVLDNTELIGLSTFNNQGTVISRGISAINGSLTTNSGSTIRVEANNTYGLGILSIANGFLNAGAIEMTSVGGAFPADIALANGEIVAGATSSLTTLAGTGGARTLNGPLLGMRDITLTPGAFGKFTMTTTALTISGKYAVEIGGVVQDTDYDRLAVVGGSAIISAGTTLDVQLANGFVPNIGDIFTILTTENGIVGDFTTMNLPTLPAGRGWQRVASAINVVLQVVAQ